MLAEVVRRFDHFAPQRSAWARQNCPSTQCWVVLFRRRSGRTLLSLITSCSSPTVLLELQHERDRVTRAARSRGSYSASRERPVETLGDHLGPEQLRPDPPDDLPAQVPETVFAELLPDDGLFDGLALVAQPEVL